MILLRQIENISEPFDVLLRGDLVRLLRACSQTRTLA